MTLQTIKTLSFLKTSKFWKESLLMTLGMFITAIAVYYFLVPSKLIIGTTSGLAIVVSDLLGAAGIPVKISICLTIINTFLLILAFYLIDGEFGVKTVYASLVLGPMMDLLEYIYPYSLLLVNPTHMEIGTAVAISGAVVSLTALSINPFRLVVIGIIGTWLNGIVIDYFTASLSKRKRVCIITLTPEPIRNYIINNLVRGCSIYDVKGGYAMEPHTEIQSLLTQSEFGNLMEFIKDNSINAFIVASNVSEVYGLWFSKSTKKEIKRNHTTK